MATATRLNWALQQTGHATDGFYCCSGPSRVGRLLSFVDYEAVGEVNPYSEHFANQ